MSLELARRIADTVLYQDGMLAPNRPLALGNRQPKSVGILYPPSCPEVVSGTERGTMHSECLVQAAQSATLQIHLRFLQLMRRQFARRQGHQSTPVPSLLVEGQLFESMDEPIEQSIDSPVFTLPGRQEYRFHIAGGAHAEPMLDHKGQLAGGVTRTHSELNGTISVATEILRPGVLKLVIDVANTSQLAGRSLDLDTALFSSLLSAHAIVELHGAEFVSLLNPPPEFEELTDTCSNRGSFPVLIGIPPARKMMLCSPVTLRDYPEIASEGVSDISAEMDETLTRRVLSMASDEKRRVANAGDRLRDLLDHTEYRANDQLSRTHGRVRRMRPAS